MLEPNVTPNPETKAEEKAKVFELRIANYRGDTPATVETPEDFQREGLKLAEVKQVRKNIETERKTLVDPLNQTVKRINAMFKAIDERFADTETWIQAPMLSFKKKELAAQQEAERKAREERERLEAERQVKIRQEMEALELARKEREATAQKLQEAQAGDDPVAAFLAEEAAEQAAEEARLALVATQQAIRDSRLPAPSEVPEFRPTTAAGISTRLPWKLIIDDPDLVPREYCIPDEKTLGQLARTLKDKFSVPGCRAEQDISFGRR